MKINSTNARLETLKSDVNSERRFCKAFGNDVTRRSRQHAILEDRLSFFRSVDEKAHGATKRNLLRLNVTISEQTTEFKIKALERRTKKARGESIEIDEFSIDRKFGEAKINMFFEGRQLEQFERDGIKYMKDWISTYKSSNEKRVKQVLEYIKLMQRIDRCLNEAKVRECQNELEELIYNIQTIEVTNKEHKALLGSKENDILELQGKMVREKSMLLSELERVSGQMFRMETGEITYARHQHYLSETIKLKENDLQNLNDSLFNCADLMTSMYHQWNKTAVAKSVYRDVNENNVGLENLPCKKLLSFYESVLTEVLKYHRLRERSAEDDVMQRWINASSFAENSEDGKQAKTTADESTMGPSRSMFIKEFNEGAKHIQVEIDKDCFRSDRPDMLDLDRVKSTNMKILSNEKSLLDSIRKGKEAAVAEREKKLREQQIRDRLQVKHIYG